MKILFINRYHIQDIPGGGGEYAMYVYAKALANLGHEVSIASFDIGDGKPKFERIEDTYDAYRVKGFRMSGLSRIPGFAKLAKKIKPDIILMSTYVYTTHGYFIAKLCGCKVASFIHDEFEVYGFRKPFNLFFIFNRIFTKMVDGIISDTQTLSKIIEKETGVKCSVSYIGFDLPPHRKKEIYRQYSDTGKPFRFVFVGRFVKAKGMDYLLNAFKKYNSFYPNSECIFIGGGEYLEEFKEKYKNVKGIKIMGYLPEDEMLETLADSDIFVNPTYLKEGIVLVNIQSMKIGLPMIVTNTGASSEVVRNGIDGILVTPRDEDELYREMVRLSLDAELQKTLAGAAMTRSEEFNASDSGKRLEKILINIVNKGKEKE